MALKLTYFNAWARAGAIRVALNIAGIPFEDERLSFPEFGAAKGDASRFPLGQAPVLLKDGRPITQSTALLRWACRKAKLYPADEDEALAIDELVSVAEDLASSAPQDPDAEAKKAKREAWAADGGKMHKFLGYLDARVAAGGGPYATGAALTMADLALVATINMIRSGNLDYVSPSVVDRYAALVALFDKVTAHPVVAAELASYKK